MRRDINCNNNCENSHPLCLPLPPSEAFRFTKIFSSVSRNISINQQMKTCVRSAENFLLLRARRKKNAKRWKKKSCKKAAIVGILRNASERNYREIFLEFSLCSLQSSDFRQSSRGSSVGEALSDHGCNVTVVSVVDVRTENMKYFPPKKLLLKCGDIHELRNVSLIFHLACKQKDFPISKVDLQ